MKPNDASKPKILVVEDDMIIAADMSMQLNKLGYDIIGINTKAEDALKMLETNRPDVILMDIILSGKMNGIEASQIILERHQIPVIFLTSNSDDATFEKALQTKPFAFISKPFDVMNIERTLKLALQRIAVQQADMDEPDSSDDVTDSTDHVSIMDDRFFIRHKHQMVKVFISDILYVEADRNYCKIFTEDQNYFLSVSLGHIESQLPPEAFIRVHRSFVVNLQKIDSIGEYQDYVMINSMQVPIARRLKDEVSKRVKMI